MDLITIKNVRGYVEDEKVMLKLEDVARGLGFVQIKNDVEYIRWGTVFNYCLEFSQQVGKESFIPENIFYKLCMKANNEIARKFQDLVCDEILPSIRKNGIYATTTTIDKMLNDPDFAINLLTKLKEERAMRIKAEEEKAILLHTNKTYTTTEIAKELGMKSATALNKDLILKRIQYKQNGTYVLYSEHANRGYTSIKQTVLDSGEIVYNTRWTDLGREWLLSKIYK